MSEVEWAQLNPARGDASPKAGALWGDRNGSGPAGFLVAFVDGFESPPHIHNVSYRGVVIGGHIHNADPNAGESWMPVGSFWTQPRGAAHITSAKGNGSVAYIEIEQGPYLVRPVEQVFHSGQEPINVDSANIAWTEGAGGTEVAVLWGLPEDDQLSGRLMKLPAGASEKIEVHGSTFRAVVIQGQLEHRAPGENQTKTLTPGSLVSSTQGAEHLVRCAREEHCLIYVRAAGRYNVSLQRGKW